MKKKLNKLNNKGGLLISTKKNQDHLFSIEGIKGEIFAVNDIVNKDLFSFNNNKGEHIIRIKPNNDILFKKLEQLPNPLNVIVINEDGKIGLGDGSGIGGGGIYINTNPVPETIGGFYEGEPATPPEGLDDTEFKDKLLFPAELPSISFNVNNETIEKGSSYIKTITINFIQNDAGNAISFSLRKNGSEISTLQTTSFNETDIFNDFTLQGFVSYEENSLLQANTINTPLRTIMTKYKIFFGAALNIPSTSSEVRNLSNNVWDNANQATLQTGTTYKKFIVAIPKSINNSPSLDVQDTTNNVGYDYLLHSSTIDVELPDSLPTLEEYNLYILETDNPFGASANHVIQL